MNICVPLHIVINKCILYPLKLECSLSGRFIIHLIYVKYKEYFVFCRLETLSGKISEIIEYLKIDSFSKIIIICYIQNEFP